jgi:hypothetical protein
MNEPKIWIQFTQNYSCAAYCGDHEFDEEFRKGEIVPSYGPSMGCAVTQMPDGHFLITHPMVSRYRVIIPKEVVRVLTKINCDTEMRSGCVAMAWMTRPTTIRRT